MMLGYCGYYCIASDNPSEYYSVLHTIHICIRKLDTDENLFTDHLSEQETIISPGNVYKRTRLFLTILLFDRMLLIFYLSAEFTYHLTRP